MSEIKLKKIDSGHNDSLHIYIYSYRGVKRKKKANSFPKRGTCERKCAGAEKEETGGSHLMI